MAVTPDDPELKCQTPWSASENEATRHNPTDLQDLNQPPRWAASLAVQAVDVRILYNFDLSQLSRGLIGSVWASDQFQHQIYGYQFDPPTVRFNIIYDKMPMEGWWPWPRRENQEKARNGVDKEMNDNGTAGNYEALI
ncbi:hypothetical protein F5Y01DRAFT_313929 [Xylaria sp. FL0043]|nr:hypothetical protein F5Y01DRAFT_313929 [Xylaria sp. FL0043]